MTDLLDVALDLQRFCEERGWEFCFIGGLAVQALAEARLTKDADMTLLTGWGEEEAFIDALLDRYQARRPDAREFALANRVLLLAENGTGIDIALGALPFEESAVKRSRYERYTDGGDTLRICSPEDLIVMKAFASREQDWRDVRMTIVRQGADSLDWDYIHRHLVPLAAAKDAPEIVDRLEALRSEYGL